MTIHEHLLCVAGARACDPALEYASRFETAQEVWNNCRNVDWLFWWAARMGQRANVERAVAELRSTSTAAYAEDDGVAIAKKHLTLPWREE